MIQRSFSRPDLPRHQDGRPDGYGSIVSRGAADLGEPAAFAWPEPLVIDLIQERYGSVVVPDDRRAIARLHQAGLRACYDGNARAAAVLRLELIAYCAARDIGHDEIAKVDRAIFWELINLVKVTFRTSPRLLVAAAQRLENALGRLAIEEKPQPVRRSFAMTETRRIHGTRAALA